MLTKYYVDLVDNMDVLSNSRRAMKSNKNVKASAAVKPCENNLLGLV
jgi:hypothetical protein